MGAMSDLYIDLDMDAVYDLADDPEAEEMCFDVGEQVAEVAAEFAPKASGAGAASIHAEVGRDGAGVFADVSWDRDHFYMYFAEVGTEHQSATPFLRPALDQARV